MAQLWLHIDFLQDGGHSKSTSGFLFGQVLHLRKSKTIGIPNLDQISQSTGEILLPFPENKRSPYSTPGFNFYHFTVIGIWLCIGLQNFMQID